MTIAKTDIKLIAAERLTDNPDGGGQMTGNEIVSGQVNNMFSDISRLDHTIGRISMRKGFLNVDTANTDTYYGAHAILTNPPADPLVNVLLMSRGDSFDERSEAADYVESYQTRSVTSDIRLYGTQPEGGRIILCLQRVSAITPTIGDVYSLLEDEGLATEQEQFVRIEDVEDQILTFGTLPNNGYQLKQLTITISDPLRYTFTGGQPSSNPESAQASDPCKMMLTAYNPIAKYYGVSKLAADVAALAGSVTVADLFQPLTPSNRGESVLADVSLNGMAQVSIEMDQTTDTIDAAYNDRIDNYISSTNPYAIGMPVVSGSVNIKYGSQSYHQFVDNGDGILQDQNNSTIKLYIDYDTGLITNPSNVNPTINWSNGIIITFTPVVSVTELSNTDGIDITEANQAFSYVKTLKPIPDPGSLVIDYLSSGQWYRLRCDAAGNINGETANTGSGTLNLLTGTVALTLAAYPDVGSTVIFSYGGTTHYENRTGDVNIKPPLVTHQLGNACYPGSLTITWLSGGVTKTATDDGAGNITGDGTGGIVYSTGKLYFAPTLLPDANSNIDFTYDIANVQSESFPAIAADGSNNINLTLTNLPVKPKSVEIEWHTEHTRQFFRAHQFWEYTGSGYTLHQGYSTTTKKTTLEQHIFDAPTGGGLGDFQERGGNIDYTTGVLSFPAIQPYKTREYNPSPDLRTWQSYSNEYDTYTPTTVVVKYIQDTGTPTQTSEQIPVPPLVIGLMPMVTDSVVPGSLRFKLGGDVFKDNAGSIYRGATELAGSIDYAAGEVTLDVWTGGGDGALTIDTLLSRFGDWTEYHFIFRTAGIPLLNSSFYLQGNSAADGALISATADANGNLTDTLLAGNVDTETGIVRVKFGEYVVAAGNEGEEWYSPSELDGNGNVWKPTPLDLNSASYNTVVLTYLPIDAALLGLDALRLPPDGKVPVFRIGDVAVLHATDAEVFASGATDGSVHNLTGSNYTSIELYDANDVQLPDALYTVDLDTTTVTMANPLDLTGYVEPLVAKKLAEQMLLVSHVDINGKISFSSAIEKAYLAANAYLSSALIFGDLQARYENLFDQNTWTGVWSDNLIGSEAGWQYNDATYPLVMENDSAIEERWALKFTSTTNVDVIGEHVGNIGNFPIATDIAPINPVTGKPYFTVLAGGWGSGQAVNNVLRFNTKAAHSSLWAIRTTLPGPETEPDDNFVIQLRGDVPQ